MLIEITYPEDRNNVLDKSGCRSQTAKSCRGGLRPPRAVIDRSYGYKSSPKGRINMPELKGSKTHQNLKDAFAGESMANRRYLYFAKVADVEGYPEIAGNFRDTAEGETGHAHGHLDYLKKVGDPATDQPFGDTSLNLKSA